MAEAPASHVEQQASLIDSLNVPSPGLSAEASLIFRGADTADPSLGLPSLLSPAAVGLYPQTLTKCLNDLSKTNSLGGLPPAQLLRSGIDRTPLLTVLGKNDPQHLKIKTPLFMAQGTADTTVIPTFTDQLDQELTAQRHEDRLQALPGRHARRRGVGGEQGRARVGARACEIEPGEGRELSG